MKKILTTVAMLVLAAATLSAQDLAQITETYNNGAAALANGEKTAALEYFQQALAAADALGETGKEVSENCKNVIPNLLVSIAKDTFKAGDIDGAIAKLKEAIPVAKGYGAEDVVADANTLIGQFLFQKGGNALNAKDYAAAADAYRQVLEATPTNGQAALRLGMALGASGDIDGAKEAFATAAANGQEKAANKQLSTLALKAAAASLKAKNYADAYEKALESAGYLPTANAYKIAGTAANALGNKADAVENLSKYLELSPNAKDAETIKAAITALKK